MSFSHDKLVLDIDEAMEGEPICKCGNDAKYDGDSGLWLCDDCLYEMDCKDVEREEFNKSWSRVFCRRMF